MSHIIKRQPYHQQAYSILKQKMLSGVLACGDVISEVDFAQEIGVSRSPVREAIRMLECDGLVVSEGTKHIVNPLDDTTLVNVYNCRSCLESYAVRLATPNFTQKDYDIIYGHVVNCREARPDDYETLIYQNTYIHDHIASLTKNDYLIELLNRIRDIVILSRFKEYKEYKRDLSYANEDHLAIAREMLAGHVDVAEKMMMQHLSNNIISFKQSLSE